MIAYFDTSALVPLLINESGSDRAGTLWDRAERLVSVRLVEVEACAALAHAQRLGRITRRELRTSRRELDELLDQVDIVDIDEELAGRAGDLAEERALRAYDAVHLAAVERVDDADTVLVAGDRALLNAAEALGIATAAIP